MPDETATAEPVDLETAKLVAATPGAGVKDNPGENDRTGEEKVEALNKASESFAGVDTSKSITELAAGSDEELRVAVSQIAYVLTRSFNIDFAQEAPISDVLSGVAAARASMSPGKESPQMVDDRIMPPGVNNPSDDVLPPNILIGAVPEGFEDHPAVVAEQEAAGEAEATDAEAGSGPSDDAKALAEEHNATPAAAQHAIDNDVDLAKVDGTGSDGTITKGDVDAAAKEQASS